ncbi:MAG: antitoxin [Luteolibacter sp.]|jgi:hypothetical protein
MRTTVTLDRDLEQILRETAVRTHKPFKKILNDTLRSALEAKLRPDTSERFVVHPKPMDLRTGLDPAGFNRLIDDLEAEAYLESTRKLLPQSQ